MDTLMDRLLNLEEIAQERDVAIVPGTTLVRCLLPKEGDGIGWSLGLGTMLCRKEFFIAKTIEEVISLAEAAFLEEEVK